MNVTPISDRISTLRSYRIMDTAPDALLDTVTRLASSIFGQCSSALGLIDAERQWFKSRYRCDFSQSGLDESICAHTIQQREVFVVPDASRDTRFDGNKLVHRPGGIRFYAGAPLIAPNGHALGTLCVFDSKPCNPDAEQIAKLAGLAELSMGLIEAHKAAFDFRDAKDYLTKLADNSPGGLFEFAMDGSGNQWLNFISRGIWDTVGVDPQEALSDVRRIFANVHPEDVPAFMASADAAYRARSRWEHQFRVNHPQRGVVWLLGVSEPTQSDQDVVTWQGFLLDISDRVAQEDRAEKASEELQQRYRELSEYQILLAQMGRMAKVGATSIDLLTGSAEWTPELYSIHEVDVGFQPQFGSLTHFCANSHKKELWRRAQASIRNGNFEFDYPIVTQKGNHRWVRLIGRTEYTADDMPIRMIGSLQDVTDERELLERVQHHATHDHLTGLSNRSHFFRRICNVLSTTDSKDRHALLFIDLDHFKDINDAFGYEVGDELVQGIAEKIKEGVSQFGSRSQVARFGGDEFGVFIADIDDELNLVPQLQSLLDQIHSQIHANGHRIRTTASMGVALFPSDGQNGHTLFRKADLALRHAKKSGRARFACFTSAMEEEATAEQILKVDLLRGIEASEFELYYQPVIDLRNSGLNGFEGLLRWHHPERGLQSAGTFAHLLDDPTIGEPISELVLEQAAATARDWYDKELAFGQIAVNITSAQLRNPMFEDRLKALIELGVRPEHIKLEITEGVLLGRSSDKVAQVLRRLRDMGFTIALDDFGTGYASLVHLTQFPIDQLKIDMSFVRKMVHSEKDRTIVQTMCSLAQGLNMTTVAEGIEDVEIEQMLRLVGCDYGQGYLYAKALCKADAEEFVASRRVQTLSLVWDPCVGRALGPAQLTELHEDFQVAGGKL